VSALATKRRRDLWRLKGQVATIALVLACGVMAMIMLRSTYGSLLAARDAYYAEHRFGDVFARLERAPEPVADELARLPGVALAYPRVVEDVMMPVPGIPDPIIGRIVSLPDDGVPPLCGLYLRAGRLPRPGVADEAVLLEQFADAHGIAPGAELPAVIAGRLHRLRVVGLAMSPEYVLAMSGRGGLVETDRFAVVWMLRGTIAPVLDMEGAFDDVVLRLEPGADRPAVLAGVDRVLARWGGLHAVARDRQVSNYALSSELGQLETLAVVIPAIFLAVAAFLVNVVVSRLVFLERTQIAVLKAVGYSNPQVGLHYLALVTLIVGLGAVVGTALGFWAGRWMTDLYAGFYRFPTRVYRLEPGLVAGTVGVGLAAGTLGALAAVRRVVRLPPAQAMRPPAPLAYRRNLLERLGLRRALGPSAMMVTRELARRPVRLALSIAGIAMAVAIYILGGFTWDSFNHLMDDVFRREHRQDLAVDLVAPRPARVAHELAAIPGVLAAEPQRAVPVRFHAGSRWRDGAIIGEEPDAELHALLDRGRVPLALPQDGVVLTAKLAEVLGVVPGETIRVEVFEGAFPTLSARVAGVIDEPFGLSGHARATWLARWLDEEPRATAVLLRVDPAQLAGVRDRLKQMPAVIGVSSPAQTIERFRAQTGNYMKWFTLILALSAAAIASGVVYNNARVALSLRARDLATLRVLGFTRREISSVLLGELAVQMALGIPLGLVVGRWWAAAYARGIEPEMIRFPLHIAPATYGAAAAIAIAAGGISALLVRKKLDRLDLVEVLKSSE
jgi:putative ABC transport system permease protein